VSKQGRQTPKSDWDLSKEAIRTMAIGILKLEYLDKGIPPPNHCELLRIAKERYVSSKKNGYGIYLGKGEIRY
jgi:hypothetical protein